MNHRPEKLILFFLKMGLRLPFFSFFATLVFSSLVFAMNGKTTYQAKIVKPDGYPLEAPVVNFKFSVLDAAASCVLYSENYSNVDMRSTGGLISFALGNGIRDFPVSGTTAVFANVFDNLITSMPCQTPGIYNPQPSDSRRVVMQFNDGTGWQTLPAMTINDVPYAMYAGKANEAKALNGKADTAFVEYSTLANLNCNSVTEAITFNGVSFSCVPVGVASSGISSVTTSGSVLITGGTASAPVISIQAATFSQDGYLTSLDYVEFKAKLSASATAIASTLGFAPVSGAAVASQIASSTLAGDVTGNPGSNTVSAVGGKSSAQISTSVDDTLAATASATASRIVKRDTSGNASFSGVSAVTANLNYVDIYKPTTSYNIRLQAPTSLSSNYILNLPSASGTTGQVLSTDGAGNLSWINPSTGSVVSVSATAPLASTGGSMPTISIAQATSGTDGYLSATDWSTFNSKQQATSSAIIATLGYEPADVSSFAAGSVPFVNSNGALAEDNSQFFWDNSNKRLGIGITTPTARFHLASGSTSVAPLKITSGSLLVSPSDGSIEYDGTFLYYTDATNTRRTLSSTGGNNTYSGTNYFSGQTYISNTTNSVNSQTGALIVSGGIGVAGNIYSSGTILTSANIQGSSITATNGIVTPVINGTSNLALNPSGGNVGIGTTTPTALLEIKTATPVVNSTFTPLKLANPVGGLQDGGGSGVGISFAADIPKGIIFYERKGSFGRGDFHFLQNTTANTSAAVLSESVMTIKNNGNVGIGITTPAALLHVSGTAENANRRIILENNGSTGNSVAEAVFKTGHSSELRVGADANGAFLYTPSTGTLRDFRIFTNATEKMRVTSEGVVGIGTANLSGGSGNTAIEGLLQVKGAASSTLFHAKGSGTEYAGFKLKVGPGNISGASDYYEFTMRPSVAAGVATTADQSLIYFNNSYSRNFVDIALNPNGGRVGIGTSSPAYRLDVLASPSAGQPGSRINVNTNSWPLLLSNTNAASGAGFVIGQSNDDLYGRGFDTSNFAIFNASTTPTDVVMYNANTPTAGFLVLKASGNVGIGTSAPNAKLEVFDGDISQVTQNPLPHTWTKGRLSYRTFTGDYSFNTGIAKYLILWPRAVGATGTNGRLVDGTLKIRRGATHAFNSGTVGHLHASSGYNGTTGESYSYTATVGGGLLFYNVVYNGVDHVALGLPNSDYKWEFRGHYGIEEQSGYGPTFVYANSPGVGAVSALTTTYFATNALFVSSGNIGIGTSAPTEKLSVDGRAIFGPNAGWNESLVVGIDGSLAATGVQSATIGATNGNLHLEPKNGFDTYINHYTSGTRHVFIQTGNSSGRVGIGTTSPSQKLHLVGDARIQGTVTDCYIGNGSGGTSCSSDERLKENIKPIPYALEKINSLRGVEFEWNQKSQSFGRHDIGVIAQDVEKVFPTAVIAGDDGYKKVDYAVLVAPLIQAVKELYNLVLSEKVNNVKQDRQIASLAESKADKAELEVLKEKALKVDKLELENIELKKKALEFDALKSYLCSKDPAAPICNR